MQQTEYMRRKKHLPHISLIQNPTREEQFQRAHSTVTDYELRKEKQLPLTEIQQQQKQGSIMGSIMDFISDALKVLFV